MLRWSIFAVSVLLWSCGTHYYVVRHAEKEPAFTMTSDVPLSAAGKERAIVLKRKLQHKNIRHIFSTNTQRTVSTVRPLSEATDVPVKFYSASDTSFIHLLKTISGNTLIAGHANNIDNLVNGLLGNTLLHDLPDKQYGDLFVVHRRGKKSTLRTKHF